MNAITKPAPLSYNLNQGQEAAADAFMNFLFSDKKEFIISGPAGVGKTYLMSYIIDATLPRYHEMCALLGEEPVFTEVVMTATTNKAAEVLTQSVKRPAGTTHSHLNLKLFDDYSSGKTKITRNRQWKVHSGQIIFVDEASLIDTGLWKEIHASTMKCKIVYVGDRHQLSPVHEDLSPIYKHNSPMVELHEPVRNAGQPALMKICDQLRKTVETKVFEPIQLVPGSIDLLGDSEMQFEIGQHFSQQTHSARILAYTNKRVHDFNEHVRAIRNLPSNFQSGEYLVAGNAFHSKGGVLAVETDVEVLQNHGPDKLLIDDDHGVHLDVDMLSIKDSLGNVWKLPVPTNRDHYSDLMRYYKREKNWEKSFFLKNNVADLRPRDAATVHKSQGSTYDTVFVDLTNISSCNFPDQVSRLLYVAFSRAKTRVYLWGDLAEKYGGLIAP
jgi:hypothetical protein